ncbi:MAG: hypothetical protein Q9169_003726 [Polycauliona sp. 2 TL-2023]
MQTSDLRANTLQAMRRTIEDWKVLIHDTVSLHRDEEMAIRGQNNLDAAAALPLSEDALDRLQQWFRAWDTVISLHPHGKWILTNPDALGVPIPYTVENFGTAAEQIKTASPLGGLEDLDIFAARFFRPAPIMATVNAPGLPVPTNKTVNRIRLWLSQVIE